MSGPTTKLMFAGAYAKLITRPRAVSLAEPAITLKDTLNTPLDRPFATAQRIANTTRSRVKKGRSHTRTSTGPPGMSTRQWPKRSDERAKRVRTVDDAKRERHARRRRVIREGREDQPGVPKRERLKAARDGEDRDVRRDGGDAEREERRDERADDERLASIPVRERAPERQEREPEQVRKRGDDADPEGNVGRGHADPRQIQRRERRKLPVARDLEESGQAEDHQHADPVRSGWPQREFSP